MNQKNGTKQFIPCYITKLNSFPVGMDNNFFLDFETSRVQGIKVFRNSDATGFP
jgi:hypothetical protein